jgi:chromate transporter
MKFYWQLFNTFFLLGLFTFGGGYAMLPLIEEKLVNKRKWISYNDFIDVLALAQGLPGSLAVNISVFIGYNIRGIPGAVITAFAVILPSYVVILIIAAFFMSIMSKEFIIAAFMGIRIAVFVLIISTVFHLSKKISWTRLKILLIFVYIIAMEFFHINPMYIVIFSALIGYYFLMGIYERNEADDIT